MAVALPKSSAASALNSSASFFVVGIGFSRIYFGQVDQGPSLGRKASSVTAKEPSTNSALCTPLMRQGIQTG